MRAYDERSHGHGKAHAAKPLGIAFGLTFFVFLIELAGGLWAGSLALLADAAHMAVDLAALGLGLFASWAAARPADAKRSFGYHRVEVLAALGNGVGLWIVVGVLLHEAWGRFSAPPAVRVPEMLGIAALGLLCNLVSGAVLYRSVKSNINLRAVFLHVASDALGSVGAIAAGLVMWSTGWMLADPLASVFICLVISVASFKLVRDSIHILLEGTPEHLDLEAVREALDGLEGVSEVHDLHLWSLSSGNESMSGHLVIRPGKDSQEVLRAGAEILERRFGIAHATLQIEAPR
ncbi:MAG: cation diffusion facilitator family transporter [Elusimicrobiota bacterium]